MSRALCNCIKLGATSEQKCEAWPKIVEFLNLPTHFSDLITILVAFTHPVKLDSLRSFIEQWLFVIFKWIVFFFFNVYRSCSNICAAMNLDVHPKGKILSLLKMEVLYCVFLPYLWLRASDSLQDVGMNTSEHCMTTKELIVRKKEKKWIPTKWKLDNH